MKQQRPRGTFGMYEASRKVLKGSRYHEFIEVLIRTTNWNKMDFDAEIWEEDAENFFSEETGKRIQNTTIDDSTSVATLGSFGSASWVAGHFVEDESREAHTNQLECLSGSHSDNHDNCRTSTMKQLKDPHSIEVGCREPEQDRNMNERGFRCPHCGKAFTRRSEMGRHVGVSAVSTLSICPRFNL